MDNSENVKNCQHCSNCCNSDTETYLEIYKLQMNVITNTSDRRINVNRYYILALSVFVLALSVIVRGGGTLAEIFNVQIKEVLNSTFIGRSVLITGVLGLLLTLSWIKNIIGYLHSNSNRYEIIKKLERLLPYQFTRSMWKLNSNGKHKKYLNFAAHEVLTPTVFCLGFLLSIVFGVCVSLSLGVGYMYSFFVLITVIASTLLSIFYLRRR